MEKQDYFSGNCPFLVYQNLVNGAIVLKLSNGVGVKTTVLTLSQINELEIPVQAIKDFDKEKFGQYYKLLTIY